MKSLKLIFSLFFAGAFTFLQAQAIKELASTELFPYMETNISANPNLSIRTPKINPNSKSIHVEWQTNSKGYSPADILYEVVLTDHGKNTIVRYRTKTKVTSVDIPANVGLDLGKSYDLIINTYLEQMDRTVLLTTENNRTTFIYEIPDCRPPSKIKTTEKGTSTLIEWDGAPAAFGKFRYEIRYRLLNQESNWTLKPIHQGNSYLFPEIESGQIYEAEVRRICILVDREEMESEWVPVGILGEKLELRATCDGVYNAPTFTTCPPANHQFTSLSITGFNIDSINITWRNGCSFSGTGRLYLTWAKKYVTVAWENARIDINGHFALDNGLVLGVRDVAPNLPNFNSNNGALKDICSKVPSDTDQWDANGINKVTGLPYDQNGFDQNGKYSRVPPYEGYEPGDPIDTSRTYDPMGYDKDGNHFETGTNKNPDGCTQKQLNSPPQSPPCDKKPDPYYWLNTKGPVTEDGAKFADKKKLALDSAMQRILPLLKIDIDEAYAQQAATCDSIRNKIRTMVYDLQYDTAYIYGRDARYLNFGMSQQFATAPQTIKADIAGRDPNDITLEADHVALYGCDIRQLSRNDSAKIIQKMNTILYASIYNKLLGLLKGFSKQQAEFYQDSIQFDKWVLDRLEEELQQKFDTRIGYQEIPPNDYDAESSSYLATLSGNRHEPVANRAVVDVDRTFIAKPTPKLIGSSVASTAEDLTAYFLEEASKQQFDFDYEQGASEVGGISRGFILEAIAKARYQYLEEKLLTEANPTLMPIELVNRGSDGKKMAVYLDNLTFRPDYAEMDVWFVLDVPGTDKRVVLKAMKVKHNVNGPVLGAVKLQLAQNIEIPISDKLKITLLKSDSTYVSVDCEGYGGLGIVGEVEFCRNFVKPVGANKKVLPDPNRVKATFKTFVTSLSDLYINIDVQPFVVTDYEDAIWNVTNVNFDFSDIISPSGASMPEEYVSPLVVPFVGFLPMWRGVYFRNLGVELPRKFAKDTTKNLTIQVENAIFEDRGFSGALSVNSILTINEGNAGGWAFSIDSLKLVFFNNELRQGKMAGKLHIPLFKNQSNTSNTISDVDCFRYTTALLKGNRYLFAVKQPLGVVYKADLWKAGEVRILDSEVGMLFDSNDFQLFARISGTIKIGGTNSGIGLSIRDTIRFENLEISNRAPYFSPGNWLVPGEIDMDLGGFGLTINNLGMGVTADNKPTLRFSARVNIGDKEQVSGGGDFRIVGKMEETDGKQKWVYDQFIVDGISVSANFSGIKLQAFLNFYEGHPTYGKGWRGGGTAVLTEFSIIAVAQFGKVNGKKYFMIDGMVCADIPLAGPLTMKGFGGGAAWGMKRTGQLPNFPLTCIDKPVVPTALGVSLSGFLYEPNDSMGLSIKAIVAMTLKKSETAFNANVSLEVGFLANGALDKIRLEGRAQMLAKLNIANKVSKFGPDSLKTQIGFNGNIAIQWDHQNEVFSADMELYVKSSVINGANNGSMGKVAILITKDIWYIKVGKPWDRKPGTVDGRCGLTIGFGNAFSVTSRSYLQIGNAIDPICPIPDKVATALGINFGNPLDKLKDATGFSFGLELGVKLDIDVAIAYAKLDLGAGLDAGMYNLSSYTCKGYGKPGYNGWYAVGQAWAYFKAEAGIKAKVFGKRRTFKIADVEAAAALQMGLPNPAWFKGGFAVKYAFLNGLVKGNAKFTLEKGTVCDLQQDSSADVELQVISGVSPIAGSKIDGNSAIKVDFAIPVNKEYEVRDLNGTIIDRVQANVEEVKMTYKQYRINTSYKMVAEDQMLVAIEDYVPTDDTLLLTVKLRIKDQSGVDTFETLTAKYFSNGAYLGTILASNILDAYPMNGQYNFYKGMSGNTGVIALKVGQPDIFWDDQYEIKAELSAKGQTKKVKTVNYDFGNSTLTYDVSDLVTGAIYRLDIIKKAKIVGRYAPVETGDGPPQLPPNNTIYTSYFRVSTHDKVVDKVNAWKNSLKDKSTNRDISLTFEPNTTMEPFDDYDLAQLKVSFDLNQVKYFNDHISDFYYSFNPFFLTIAFPCVAGRYDYYKLSKPNDALKLVKSVSSPLLISKADYIVGQNILFNTSKTSVHFDFPEKFNTELGYGRTWLLNEVQPYLLGLIGEDCQADALTKIATWTAVNQKFPTITTGSALPFTWEYKVLNKVSYAAQQYGNNGSPLGNSNSLNNKITLTVGQ